MRTLLLAWTAAGALAACGENEPSAPPVPEGLVLEFDGLRIWQHEVEPLRRYARSVDSRTGEATLLGGLLNNFLIPLKLAQRAFAEQRAEQRALAEGLRDAVDNEGYPGLLQKGRRTAGEEPDKPVTRNDLPLPLAAWAFDDANWGQVSPVIETPQGFALIATKHIDRGTTRLDDLAQVYQVSFYTHDSKAFAEWYFAVRPEVAGKVTYVHPDYRRALPAWIQ